MSKRAETLGAYVRQARAEHSWTQGQLAVRMGLGLCSGQVTVSEVERDQRRPRPESLSKFVAALELDCQEVARLAAKAYEKELLGRLRGN